MSKKLLLGVLASALLMGGAMSVTSCKDDIEDIRAELKSDNLSLQDKVKILQDAYDLLKQHQQECEQKCNSFTAWETNLNTYLTNAMLSHTLAWYLQQIEGALKGADGTEYDSLADRLGQIDAVLLTLKNHDVILFGEDGKSGLLGGVQDKLDEFNTDLPGVIEAAMNAAATANKNKAILEALLKGYDITGNPDYSSIEGLLKKFETDIATANTNADKALKVANGVAADLVELEKRVAENEKAIKRITTKLDALTGQINKLITSIILQQVNNPVFGKINLPVDVKSGMLLAYYGEAIDVKFPAFNTTTSEYDGQLWLTNDDKTVLNINPEDINGVLGVEKDGKFKLGKIYMTVNPANFDYEGTSFDFVNSLGQNPGNIQLSSLAVCDDELKFGFGRAAADAEVPTSFYTADAYISDVHTAADLAPVKFTVQSDFMQRVEEMLKSHTLSDAATLTKLIFDQFNNKLTAYGVRAAWQYDAETGELDADGNPIYAPKTNATYSELALAATTFKPLSYKFLYGKSFRPIGTISPIEDFTLGYKLDIKVPEFEFNLENIPFNFHFKEISVNLEDVEIVVTVPKTTVYDDLGNPIGYIEETTAKAKNLKGLEEAISKAISNSLSSQDAELQNAFKQAMAKVAEEMNKQINKKMAEFKTDIDKQFNDIIKDIEGKVNGYLGTVNKYINKVNGLINRVNKILSDPNHYLQVTMLYEAGDGQFHQLSNNPALPSMFKLNGGNGIRLFATSFNGDLLVPSYKKFVAVTNAFVTATDTQDKDEIAAANAVANWNTVVPGTTTEYAFKLKKGYTYEVVYSSVDYHGVTSTRKFYISAE